MSILTYKEAKKFIRLDSYRDIAEKYNKIINLGVEEKWNSICALYSGTDLDPADEAYEDVEMLRLFSYRMSLMLICCLCETWEQDLYNFLKEENLDYPSENDFNRLKSSFNRSFPNLSLDSYTKIREMRSLVNAIKHGKGNSFEALKQVLGDSILADSNFGYIADDGTEHLKKQILYDDNTLTSITLKPQGKITEYYNEIISFWNDVFREIDSMGVQACLKGKSSLPD